LANIALNQLTDRITVHNIALGASNNDKLMLELCQNNLGNHRIRTEENGSRLFKNSIAVKSETLDSVVGELDDLSRILIWIDTQGYEGYILSGASIALKHNIPICLEFWPHGMAESGCYPILKQEILRHKYRYYYNLDDIGATPVVLSDNSLDALYERLGDEGSFTDLLIT
jgi:FkbM family methyltransferase